MIGIGCKSHFWNRETSYINAPYLVSLGPISPYPRFFLTCRVLPVRGLPCRRRAGRRAKIPRSGRAVSTPPQSFVVAEFYFLRAGARAGNWQLWLDRRLTSQLTGQIVWLVNWPVKYNSPRETVRWYPLIKCIFLQYKIIIVNADGNDKPITWIEWTIENINYYKKTKNCPKIDQKLPKMTKNSQKSLTGQRGFDWSNSQLVWLVNDWLTSHLIPSPSRRRSATLVNGSLRHNPRDVGGSGTYFWGNFAIHHQRG